MGNDRKKPKKTTPAEFRAFVDYASESLGWSGAELARRLDCGRNQITTWQETGCPPYIALACSALVARLPPFFMPAKL